MLNEVGDEENWKKVGEYNREWYVRVWKVKLSESTGLGRPTANSCERKRWRRKRKIRKIIISTIYHYGKQLQKLKLKNQLEPDILASNKFIYI